MPQLVCEVSCAAWTIRLEEQDGYVWGHCEVRHWSHHVARELVAEWRRLGAVYGLILATPTDACASGAAYEVWRKFVRLVGFQFQGTLTNADGKRCSVYVRRG